MIFPNWILVLIVVHINVYVMALFMSLCIQKRQREYVSMFSVPVVANTQHPSLKVSCDDMCDLRFKRQYVLETR